MERTTETHYPSGVAGRKRHEPGEFPANLTPWLALERLGVTVRRLPTADGAFTAEAAVLLNMQPRTVGRYEAGDSVPHPAQQAGMLSILRAELKKRARRKPSAG